MDVDSKNSAELLRKIGKVNKLPSQIKSRVESIDDEDHELFLRKLKKVKITLGKLNFNARCNNFVNLIDEATLSSLEFTSNLLSKENGEKGLSKNEIEKLLDAIHQFKKELIDSSIPEVLKRFILERLEDIESAVYDYNISGVEPIEIEIERSVESLIMRRGIYSKDKDWTKKFFRFINRIAAIVSFANDSQSLLGTAKKFLKD